MQCKINACDNNCGSENITTSLGLAGTAETRRGDLVAIFLKILSIFVLILFRYDAASLASICGSLRLQTCYSCHSLIWILTVHMFTIVRIGVSARATIASLRRILLNLMFSTFDLPARARLDFHVLLILSS